MEREIIDTLI